MGQKLYVASMTIFLLIIQFGDSKSAEDIEDSENQDLMYEDNDLVDDLDEDDHEITKVKRSLTRRVGSEEQKWRQKFIDSLTEEFKKQANKISNIAVDVVRARIKAARSGKFKRGKIPYFKP